MPANAIVETPKTPEIEAIEPLVTLNGKDQSKFIKVMMIEDSTGVVPGKCRFKIFNSLTANDELSTQQTLLAMGKNNNITLEGMRIRVFARSNGIPMDLFLGNVYERDDIGSMGEVIYTAYDDTYRLKDMPVRGAIIYRDSGREPSVGDNNAVMLRRYIARFNPGGQWNCTGAQFTFNENGSDVTRIYPVFTPEAHLGKNYESPDEAFTDVLAEGVTTAWTPRRMLWYLQLLSRIDETDCDGIIKDHWRSIKNSQTISFAYDDISTMEGIDPARENIDPLDRKLPDLTVQGDAALYAIQKALDAAGTHGIYGLFESTKDASADPASADALVHRTALKFHPIGYSALIDSVAVDLNLYRAGNIHQLGDPNTIYDYTVHSDARPAADAVLVEGSPIHLETRIEYTGTPATDTLIRAWTDEEQDAFTYVIEGSDSAVGTYEWARYPEVQDQVEFVDEGADSWLYADGKDGRPFAQSRSSEALTLARQTFPRVFRAFRLSGENLQATNVTDGYNDEFSNTTDYPFAHINRPILAEQLQFMLGNVDRDSGQENWLKTKFPNRVEVKSTVSEKYNEAGSGGIRTTPDGLIWLDGYGESVQGMAECMFEGVLIGDNSDPIGVAMRNIRINVALPLDHRTVGYKSQKSMFNKSYNKDLGGVPIKYIDSPNAYKEDHQRNSFPSAMTQYYGGTDGDILTTGDKGVIDRILPPGSEEYHAVYAAERKLQSIKQPIRNSTWKLPGIRTDMFASQWIRNVNLIGDASNKNYKINAPIDSLVWDFMAQETTINGLISQITGA